MTRTAAPLTRGRPRAAGGPGRRPARAATPPETATAPAPARTAARRRLPFLLLVGGLLASSLLALLLLNTFSAQYSFRLNSLQTRSAALADTEQQLALRVARLDAPGALAARAAALGMVPGGPPAFIQLPQGQVLGSPTPAPSPTSSPATAASPAAAPTPTATASPAATISPSAPPASPSPAAPIPTPTGAAAGLSSH